MNNTNPINGKLNLIGNYKMKTKDTRHDYKAKYSTLFPTKMSSSSFLLLYTLFILDKKAEPLYGKEILSEIQKCVRADIWKPSNGTYYPLLDDMVKSGYIEMVKSSNSKKFYAITELGTSTLALKLGEFKPILIGASEFFSHMLTEMYNEAGDKASTTDTIRTEDNLDIDL